MFKSAMGPILPPSLPLNAIVLQPMDFAYSSAATTFGELPEQLTVMNKSPARAKFFKGSTNTAS